jgi:hypothetical protein
MVLNRHILISVRKLSGLNVGLRSVVGCTMHDAPAKPRFLDTTKQTCPAQRGKSVLHRVGSLAAEPARCMASREHELAMPGHAMPAGRPYSARLWASLVLGRAARS